MRSIPILAALLLSVAARADAQPKAAPAEKGLEAKLAGRSPEEVQAILDQFAREWLARRGAVEVTHQRFTAQAEELKKARQRLAYLKQPDTKAPLMFKAEDVGEAIKVAQQLADYHASRVRHLEAVATSTDAILKLATDFDRAHAVADTHRNAIDFGLKFAGGRKLPDALTPKRLDADAEKLKALAKEVGEARDKAKAELKGVQEALKTTRDEYVAAKAKLEELQASRDSLVAAFEFEERVKGLSAGPLADEFNRLLKELAEKSAAIKPNADDYAKAAQAADEARAKLGALKEPPVAPEEKPDAALPPLEKAARNLFAAQQQYAARLRAADERAEKSAALVAALDEQERKATAYLATLDGALVGAAQLAAAASEISRRVARGDLEAAKVPEGVADATGTSGEQSKLEADAKDVREALAKLRHERDALRKPDPEAANLKSLTATLLGHVTARIDLLTDLKKLAADYATARKDLPESEQKRLDQRAADRAAREAAQWDQFLALDRSKPAADRAALLDSYYRELVELDEKQGNLDRQRKSLETMAELTRKEADDIAKLRAVLEERVTQSEPVRAWDEWLAARLAPAGLKAEAGIYHDERARLDALSGANARRVQSLSGNEATEASKTAEQAKLPATGGEIGAARRELFEARVRGLAILGIKIGLVLLAALVLPRLAVSVLRRAIRGGSDEAGNPSPVLGPLRRILKLAAWVAALLVILSILGYDVTAAVVALAIVALALALAARPVIADVLGSMVIFAERRFKVGDVVRLAGGEPARVVEITWRSTSLKNSSGLALSVPNRTVTEVAVENLSRGTETYDSLAVTVSTDKDAGRVIGVIRAAMAQCKNLSPEQGVAVVSFTQKGPVKVVQYRFWWFLKDFEARNKTRDEVLARIAMGLAQEDMTGIEVTLG